MYKNIEMEQMIAALEPLLERTDLIGYAAARNTRILRTEAQEYLDRREQLIEKYGEPQLDEEGNPTGITRLLVNSPEFNEYARDIEQWALIEHDPKLFRIPVSKALDAISGNELLEIEWMFDWDES